MFCTCGISLKDDYKICPNFSAPVATSSQNDESLISFENFLKRKSRERQSQSYRVLKKVRSSNDEIVNMNIGLMEKNGESVSIIRGKMLGLRVVKSAAAESIFELAIKKRIDHDASFRTSHKYFLAYPDGRTVAKMPGSEEDFTISKYKEEVGKPYQRICLYLCTAKHSLSSEDIGTSHNKDQDITKFIEKPCCSNSVKMGRCPVCNIKTPLTEIEQHVDNCLNKKVTPFEEASSHDSPSGSENESAGEEHPKTKDEYGIKSNILLALKETIVDESQTLQISVRRGFAFYDFRSFFKKKWNASRQNQLYNITFLGEAGIDTGGVSRDFYTEALNDVKSQYFAGVDSDGLTPSCGLVSIADGTMQSIGHLFAASLQNGGPGPGFLAPWVYRYLFGGMEKVLKLLPEKLESSLQFSDLYAKLKKADNCETVIEILTSDMGYDVLESIGYRAGVPNRWYAKDFRWSIYIQSIVEPFLPPLDSIANGLKCYGISKVVMRYIEDFYTVFCPSPLFKWDFEKFFGILSPVFSENGSTNHALEITVYKHFIDFAELCYFDDAFPVTLGQLMKFVTGSPSLPPLGLPKGITVEFVHGCQDLKNGMKCKCLPSASTCAIALKIPVHIADIDSMKESFLLAVNCEPGFGCV